MRGAFVVLLLAGACSSGGGAGDTVPSPPRPDPSAVSALLARLCAAAVPCCGAIGIDTASEASCLKELQRGASGTLLDAGEACLREISPAGVGSSCFRVADSTNDPCIRMFSGHFGAAKPGDACTNDADCALPTNGISVCRGFKCRWLFDGKDGDGPCIADYVGEVSFGFSDNEPTEGLLCEHGLYCDIPRDGQPRKCRAYLAAGQSCAASYQCAGICVGPGCSSTLCNGTCQEGRVGDPCAGAHGCAPGGYCDSTATCAAVEPAGAACQEGAECESQSCQENKVCSRLGHLSYAFAANLCGVPSILP